MPGMGSLMKLLPARAFAAMSVRGGMAAVDLCDQQGSSQQLLSHITQHSPHQKSPRVRMGKPACTRLARRCSRAAACGGGTPLAVVAVRCARARCSSAASPSSGCLRAGT